MYNTFNNYMNPHLTELLRQAAIENMIRQSQANIEDQRKASGPLIIPQYVYHLTLKKNLKSILNDNALRSAWGDIYVCPTLDDLRKFRHLIKTSPKDYIVLKIATKGIEKAPWDISFDHNRKYIDADALVYYSKKLVFNTPPEVIPFTI